MPLFTPHIEAVLGRSVREKTGGKHRKKNQINTSRCNPVTSVSLMCGSKSDFVFMVGVVYSMYLCPHSKRGWGSEWLVFFRFYTGRRSLYFTRLKKWVQMIKIQKE
jgi:hypothetical protein